MNAPRFNRNEVMAFLLAALALAGAAQSADPPEAIEQRKKDAEEVLIVEVTAVKQSTIENGTFAQYVYTARVAKVIRSKSGRKAGDNVRVQAVAPNPGAQAAGSWPAPLAKGWRGTMYLDSDDERAGQYTPAANHESFKSETK